MLKRFFDIFLSSVGLILSFPFWFIIFLSIKIEDRGSIFYPQERVAKNGKIFRILKCRSMIPDAEKHTGAVWTRENDPRVTKIGKILRASAMDELPQLWNILKGKMSFVGPRAERPELVNNFVKDVPNFNGRLLVRPGLTGLAQIYGRYDTDPKNKLR
jgi:lipopolysaccharide/colanic/teichoic acid biosynthesis glycosyltransferase